MRLIAFLFVRMDFLNEMKPIELHQHLASMEHRATRAKDMDNVLNLHPLLSGKDSTVKELPSSKELSKLYSNLCGGRHQGHRSNAPESCYMHYSTLCDPADYAPRAPISRS